MPPSLSGAGFAYDPISKTAVLFGGNPGNFVYADQTWTWDGRTWTQQLPPVSPSARAFNTEPMAFDKTTGTVVLFGGFANGGTSLLGDTWVWNGRTKLWAERFPANSPSPRATTVAYDSEFPASSPAARANYMMDYDANPGRVVLFGGDSPGGKHLNDTWTWDGTTWTLLQTPVTPSARSDAAMSYNPAGDLVLFGGFLNNSSYSDSTWLFLGGRGHRRSQ